MQKRALEKRATTVTCAILLSLTLLLFSCSNDAVEPANFSLTGIWIQYSEGPVGAYKTVISFDDNGNGEVWSAAIDGVSLTEVYSFRYSVVEYEKVILSYDNGSSDTLHLSDFRSDKVSIIVEGHSDWLSDGILTRIDDDTLYL